MTITVKDARTADEVLGEFENAIIIVPFLASAPFFLARHTAHARLLPATAIQDACTPRGNREEKMELEVISCMQ